MNITKLPGRVWNSSTHYVRDTVNGHALVRLGKYARRRLSQIMDPSVAIVLVILVPIFVIGGSLFWIHMVSPWNWKQNLQFFGILFLLVAWLPDAPRRRRKRKERKAKKAQKEADYQAWLNQSPPPPYNHVLHWRSWVIKSMKFWLPGGIFSAMAIWAVINGFIHPLFLLSIVPVVLIVRFFCKRAYWMWREWPYKSRPQDGRLKHVQKQNRKLLIPGSSDDTYPLGQGDVVMDSPRRTIFEMLFFRRSQTLILRGGKKDGVLLKQKYIINLEHLLRIDEWRRELETASVDEQRRTNQLLEQIVNKDDDPQSAADRQETNKLLGEIARELKLR